MTCCLWFFSCWKGQVWHGLAHCSLLALSVWIRQSLSWQHLILETDLPFWISLKSVYSPMATAGLSQTASTFFLLTGNVKHKMEPCQMDNAGKHPPSMESSLHARLRCSEGWMLGPHSHGHGHVAPWQVTHSPPTPSVPKAVAVTTQATPLTPGVCCSCETANHIPHSSQCNSPKHISPLTSPRHQLVILQHMWFPKSAPSLQPTGRRRCADPTRGVSTHCLTDCTYLSTWLWKTEYLPRPGLESALAGSCLSFFPLIFLF